MSRRAVLLLAGGLVAGALLLPTGGFARVAKEVTDVFITNTAANPVPVMSQLPQGAFSVEPVFGVTQGLLSGPDPSGTRYAITSMTVGNISNDRQVVSLFAGFGSTNNCETVPGAIADGPQAVVPPNSTVHLVFPQPFIFPAGAGANACLKYGSTSSLVNVSVVGYRS